MPTVYKLVAAPHLLPAGDFKGHLETVTFIAANENETHIWWAVNVGTFERTLRRLSRRNSHRTLCIDSAKERSLSSRTAMSWPR